MDRSVAVIGTRGYPSYYGGFETLVRKLAPYLVEHGWDVTVYGRTRALAPTGPGRHVPVRSVVTPGLDSRSLSTLSYGLTSTVHAAWRAPSVALVMNVANGYWLPLLRARGIPVALNVDGLEWERAKWNSAAKKLFRGGARLSATWASTLIYDSCHIAAYWQDHHRRSGETIAYGGDEVDALPRPPGLERGDYILYVARFVPENTIGEFLDAAPALSRRWPVVIVGSSGHGGDIETRVERLAAENRNIRWLGHLSDDSALFSLFQHCGAYFHGHSVGGTNPALVQAMHCGARVVARDTVYNREVLGDAGTYSRPSPPAIDAALRSAMERPELRQGFAEAAVSRARQNYDWKDVCNSYADILERLSRRRDRPGPGRNG